MPTDFPDYLRKLSPQERGLLFCLPQFMGQYIVACDGHASLRETNRMWDVISSWEKIDGAFEIHMKVHVKDMQKVAEQIKNVFVSKTGHQKLSSILDIMDAYAKLIHKMPANLRSRTRKYIYDTCMAVAASDGPTTEIGSIGLQERAAIEMIYDSFGIEEEEGMNLIWSRVSA